MANATDKEALGYLRALMKEKEYSERALELTEEVLAWNAGHYSVWQYRRDILNGMDSNWSDELFYTQEMATENPKNYQIWHHRQVIVDELKNASMEIGFINAMLENDAKNYHAWSYRYRAFLDADKDVDSGW
jgi:protein farnesyltransferase/geranylgeranyltransferase type-1 subunit alpha